MALQDTDAPQEIHPDELAGMGPGEIPEKPSTPPTDEESK